MDRGYEVMASRFLSMAYTFSSSLPISTTRYDLTTRHRLAGGRSNLRCQGSPEGSDPSLLRCSFAFHLLDDAVRSFGAQAPPPNSDWNQRYTKIQATEISNDRDFKRAFFRLDSTSFGELRIPVDVAVAVHRCIVRVGHPQPHLSQLDAPLCRTPSPTCRVVLAGMFDHASCLLLRER
ncbi:hypothetical protein SCHPADRAFT_707887 [Schizopora paradoxa]|uniref:Uncharacterized protein n=1 Tax=Schizopora paradoxa TaxID=27342 RepID=A0A0H2RLZ7_9AGAM|nr:hypothetical protein SCHPADRAFT_707887 [Schizopora paradoxa]